MTYFTEQIVPATALSLQRILSPVIALLLVLLIGQTTVSANEYCWFLGSSQVGHLSFADSGTFACVMHAESDQPFKEFNIRDHSVVILGTTAAK